MNNLKTPSDVFPPELSQQQGPTRNFSFTAPEEPKPTEKVIPPAPSRPLSMFQDRPGDQIQEQKNKVALDLERSKRNAWVWVYTMQAAIALITVIIVAIFLYTSNAPITQKKAQEEGFVTMEQDGKAVFIVCLIVFVFVLFFASVWHVIGNLSAKASQKKKQ